MTSPDARRRPLVPHYPPDAEIRAFLPLLDGVPRRLVTGMAGTLAGQRGTLRLPTDWSDPDTWIGERLGGEQLVLARRVWEGSGRTANPRNIGGAWDVVTHHDLVADAADGILRVTERGRAYLAEEQGRVAREIDDREGILKILAMIIDRGSAMRSELDHEWHRYLLSVSTIRAESVARHSLAERLRNLRERGLVIRSSLCERHSRPAGAANPRNRLKVTRRSDGCNAQAAALGF